SKSSRKVAFMARHLDDSAHVRVIHLVRDPRGFVASTVRYNEGASLRTSSWLWSDLHRRMEGLQSRVPYLRVRYEDLAQHPEEQMTAIMRFLDVSYEPVVAAPKFPE